MNRKRHSGFTLLELLVVVGINVPVVDRLVMGIGPTTSINGVAGVIGSA